MATFGYAESCGGGQSAVVRGLIQGTPNLQRGLYANGSNCGTTKTECEANGIGFSFVAQGLGACMYPCPGGYRQSDTNISVCEPRPLLTAIEVYYEVLQNAASSCADKSEAYRKAVEESGKDPSAIAFPPDCPNPFAPSPSETDPLNPQDVPPPADVPYIPEPPASSKEIDSSGGVGEPLSRITITEEDLQYFKTTEYGVERLSSLGERLKLHPTLADANPQFLTEIAATIPNFVWSVNITQDEFDQMTDENKCVVCKNFKNIYANPGIITQLRKDAPTITITRDAPQTPPDYLHCPEDERRQACVGKTGYQGQPCTYSGGCLGICVCPEPPPPSDTSSSSYTPSYSDIFKSSPSLQTSLLLAGGGIIGLYVLYQVFKAESGLGAASQFVSSSRSIGGIGGIGAGGASGRVGGLYIL